MTNRERQQRYYRANKAKCKAKSWRAHLKAAYGLSVEEYERLAAAQDHRCAICRRPPSGVGRSSKLHVDHNHHTHALRGLLCFGCNTGMGTLGDNPERLEAAAAYLRRYD